MKLTNKFRNDLERALRCLNDGLKYLEDSQGVAKPVPEERSLGSSYRIKNPACVEHCANHAEFVNVWSYVGSDAVKLWTAKSMIEGLLNSSK